MKEGQKDIYYITGESQKQLEASPFIEQCKQRYVDALNSLRCAQWVRGASMTDPIDEYAKQQLKDFEDKKFICVTKEGLKFEETEEDKKRKEDEKSSFENLALGPPSPTPRAPPSPAAITIAFMCSQGHHHHRCTAPPRQGGSKDYVVLDWWLRKIGIWHWDHHHQVITLSSLSLSVCLYVFPASFGFLVVVWSCTPTPHYPHYPH